MNRFFLITILLVLPGCFLTGNRNPGNTLKNEQAATDIKSARDATAKAAGEVESSAKKVRKDATDIKVEAASAKTKIPDEAKKDVDPHLDKIDTSADLIIDESNKLQTTSERLLVAKNKLSAAMANIGDLSQQVEKLQSENEKLKKDNHDKLNIIMYGIIAIGIVFIGISAVLICNGSKKGISLGIAGIVFVIMAVAISFYAKAFAIIGVIAVIAIIVGFILQVRDHKIYKKAFEECVEIIEVLKDYITEEETKKIFGDRQHPGIIHGMQSEHTKRIVDMWRTVKKKHWEPTVKTITSETDLTNGRNVD